MLGVGLSALGGVTVIRHVFKTPTVSAMMTVIAAQMNVLKFAAGWSVDHLPAGGVGPSIDLILGDRSVLASHSGYSSADSSEDESERSITEIVAVLT